MNVRIVNIVNEPVIGRVLIRIRVTVLTIRKVPIKSNLLESWPRKLLKKKGRLYTKCFLREQTYAKVIR